MVKAWKQWKKRTDLPGKTFLKLYIWDRILIRPRKGLKKWAGRNRR